MTLSNEEHLLRTNSWSKLNKSTSISLFVKKYILLVIIATPCQKVYFYVHLIA